MNLFNKIFNSHLSEKGYNLITPTKDSDRGSHITISHKESWRISKCLISPKGRDKKILIDFRPNKFIRISLTPLYTSFEDIYNLTKRLFDIVKLKEYMNHDNEKPTLT